MGFGRSSYTCACCKWNIQDSPLMESQQDCGRNPEITFSRQSKCFDANLDLVLLSQWLFFSDNHNIAYASTNPFSTSPTQFRQYAVQKPMKGARSNISSNGFQQLLRLWHWSRDCQTPSETSEIQMVGIECAGREGWISQRSIKVNENHSAEEVLVRRRKYLVFSQKKKHTHIWRSKLHVIANHLLSRHRCTDMYDATVVCERLQSLTRD